MLIAAVAMEHQLVLATRNVRNFLGPQPLLMGKSAQGRRRLGLLVYGITR